MSLKLVAVASVLALVAGCSHKKDREAAVDEAAPLTPPIPKTTGTGMAEAPGTGSGAGAGAASMTGPESGSGSGSTGSGATAPIQYGCDKIFPQALRDKYFAKATVEASTVGSGSCALTLADKQTAKITAVCFDTIPPDFQNSTFDKLAALGLTAPTTVPGVGKDTRFTATSATANTVVAWDDDSNCSISAEIPKTVDVPAFAKDALTTFPVK